MASGGTSVQRAVRKTDRVHQSGLPREPDLFTKLEKIETPVSVPPLPQHWKSWNVAQNAGLELTDVALDQSRARRSVTAARVASADQPLGVRTAPVNIVDNSATAHLLGAYVAVVNDVENAAVDQTIGTYVTAVNVVARIAADPVLDPHLLPVAAIENATDNYSPLRYLGAPAKIADNTAIDHGLSANGATPGWSVQLLGNSSEFGALTSYHQLQATYSALLGPVQPIIIRSAVGANAYWYRVRLAAESRQNAEELCGGLRAAGGTCLVQRD